MTAAVLGPMPGSSSSVPSAWRRASSSSASSRTRSAALQEGGAPSATRPASGRAGRRPGRGRRPGPSASRTVSAGSAGRGHGRTPASRWNASGSSASPTPASRRCTTRSPAAARSPRRTRSPPPTPTSGMAKVPDHRLDALAEMSKSARTSCPPPCSSSTSAGWSRGPARARASATGSSATSARSTPSSSCCGPSPTTTCPGPSDPLEHLAHRRARARPRRPRDRREPDREAPQGGQGRQVARSTRWPRSTRRTAVLDDGHAALPGRPQADERDAAAGRTSCSPTSPVLAVVNIGEDQLDDVDAVVAPVRGRARRPRPRCIGMCVQLEAEAAQLDADERAEMLEASASARARCPGSCTPPTTCSACARSSPPARRSRGRGRSGPGPRPRSAPGVIHTDFERGFIRAEVIHWDELLELGSWTKAKDVGKLRVEGKDYEVVGRRRPRDPLQRLSAGRRRSRCHGWLLRDGEVLAASRSPTTAARAGAGPARAGRRRRRAAARARPGRCTPSACASRSTSPGCDARPRRAAHRPHAAATG